jgi:tetrahydromethanopterin S-methyltransferase subunit B
LSRKQLIGASLVSLVMIGIQGFQLVTVERQRRIAARQEQRVIMSLETVREQARELRRGVGGAAPQVLAGLERADGLVRGLARNDAPQAIAEAGRLAQRLQDADLAGRVEVLTRAVLETTERVRELEQITRDTRDDVELLTVETLEFQRETLGIQRELLALLRRSLEIQEELLVRVRSIDERTGGVVPVQR